MNLQPFKGTLKGSLMTTHEPPSKVRDLQPKPGPGVRSFRFQLRLNLIPHPQPQTLNPKP